MKPSSTNPVYTVYLIAKRTGKKYDVTTITTSLQLSESNSQIAQKCQITLVQMKVDGIYLHSLVRPRDRLYVYANTGSGSKEVFRGYVWEKPYSSSTEKELTIICYDGLIYMQESQDSKYFSAGKSTQSVLSSICESWGVPLTYNYGSITHPKLPLSGNLSDIITSDLLDEVKKQNGKKYVLYSDQDKMIVDYVGYNKTIYEIRSKQNALYTKSTETMSGVITKVIITGKEDDDERKPVEATIEGDTATYGTIQKVISNGSGTELDKAKKEANETLKENGKPKKTYNVSSIDIPWVRKGHKVKVSAGSLTKTYIVTGVSHDAVDKTMELDLEDE